MRAEERTLHEIRAEIERLPEMAQVRINAYAKVLRDLLAQDMSHVAPALALVGAELAAQEEL